MEPRSEFLKNHGTMFDNSFFFFSLLWISVPCFLLFLYFSTKGSFKNPSVGKPGADVWIARTILSSAQRPLIFGVASSAPELSSLFYQADTVGDEHVVINVLPLSTSVFLFTFLLRFHFVTDFNEMTAAGNLSQNLLWQRKEGIHTDLDSEMFMLIYAYIYLITHGTWSQLWSTQSGCETNLITGIYACM